VHSPQQLSRRVMLMLLQVVEGRTDGL